MIKGFPEGFVVKTPPANAGDTGSIPNPGRSHVWAEPLILGAATIESVL